MPLFSEKLRLLLYCLMHVSYFRKRFLHYFDHCLILVDRENCVLVGLTSTYNQCYQDHAGDLIQQRTAENLIKETCVWHNYENCVNKYVGHCEKAWLYFELWNRGLAPEKQISEQDKKCSSYLIKREMSY